MCCVDVLSVELYMYALVCNSTPHGGLSAHARDSLLRLFMPETASQSCAKSSVFLSWNSCSVMVPESRRTFSFATARARAEIQWSSSGQAHRRHAEAEQIL